VNREAVESRVTGAGEMARSKTTDSSATESMFGVVGREWP
jgi:hypothetical protein